MSLSIVYEKMSRSQENQYCDGSENGIIGYGSISGHSKMGKMRIHHRDTCNEGNSGKSEPFRHAKSRGYEINTQIEIDLPCYRQSKHPMSMVLHLKAAAGFAKARSKSRQVFADLAGPHLPLQELLEAVCHRLFWGRFLGRFHG